MLIAYEVEDVRRFASEKKFFSSMGLVPSTYSSGGRTFHGRLTKQGNKYLRWAFVEAVYPAIRRDPWLRAYYEAEGKERGQPGESGDGKEVGGSRLSGAFGAESLSVSGPVVCLDDTLVGHRPQADLCAAGG